jgi:hypothetical protein
MFTRQARAYGVAAVVGLVATGVAPAQQPKPEKKNGHSSVPSVTVMFRNGGTGERKGLLLGTTKYRDGDLYSPFVFRYADTGTPSGAVWIDTIASLKEASENGVTIMFKDGSSRAVQFGKDGHQYMLIHTPEGGNEVIDLGAVKEVRFGKPARKDAEGNAMFDHWKFSPFTGEKLAPVEADGK